MKVAIIGAGIAGLACAKECERLGIVADLYERDCTVGMKFPFVIVIPEILFRNLNKDIITEFKENYHINLKPTGKRNKFVMKSAGQTVVLEGDLGYFFLRGKSPDSLENQLLAMLTKTPVHYNANVTYQELSSVYDYVVVASGKDTEAAELGVWQNHGQVSTINGVVLGKFDVGSSHIFFNTEYGGSGFARLGPFSETQALVELNAINHQPFDLDKLYSRFLKQEKLESLEFFCVTKPPVFQTGRVEKFTIGNILLTGRAAGLTERLLGVGAPFALMSGVLAARAIKFNLDYEKILQPMLEHVENLSSMRNLVEKFSNKDYDMLLSVIGTPGIQQLIYNTKINFLDIAGMIVKSMYKGEPPLNFKK